MVQLQFPYSDTTTGLPNVELSHMAYMPCSLHLSLQLHSVVLNLLNVTYGRQDLAYDTLPAADVFSGLQVAGNSSLPAEAAQHSCVSGAGWTWNKPSSKWEVFQWWLNTEQLCYDFNGPPLNWIGTRFSGKGVEPWQEGQWKSSVH